MNKIPPDKVTHVREVYGLHLNEDDLINLHKGKMLSKLLWRDEASTKVVEICVSVLLTKNESDAGSEDVQDFPTTRRKRKR